MAKTSKLRCSACKVEHPIVNFSLNSRYTRGYEYVCKQEKAKLDKAARKRRKKNLERAREMGLLV
jgi:hypothetical protein